MKVDKGQIGLAGEFRVASEILRRGYFANMKERTPIFVWPSWRGPAGAVAISATAVSAPTFFDPGFVRQALRIAQSATLKT